MADRHFQLTLSLHDRHGVLEEETLSVPATVLQAATAWFHQAVAAVELVLRGHKRGDRYAHNPQLVIYNPPVGFKAASKAAQGRRVKGVISRDVHEVRYTHYEDGQDYRHPFEGKVLMVAVEQPDGQRDIILTHEDGLPLWEDF